MRHGWESQLVRCRNPRPLKIVALMMRQHHASRIQIDVQHLARPRGRHEIRGRRRLVRHRLPTNRNLPRRRIENERVLLLFRVIGRCEQREDAGLRRAPDARLVQILRHDHAIFGRAEVSKKLVPARRGGPANESVARRRRRVANLPLRESNHAVIIATDRLAGENDSGRLRGNRPRNEQHRGDEKGSHESTVADSRSNGLATFHRTFRDGSANAANPGGRQ